MLRTVFPLPAPCPWRGSGKADVGGNISLCPVCQGLLKPLCPRPPRASDLETPKGVSIHSVTRQTLVKHLLRARRPRSGPVQGPAQSGSLMRVDFEPGETGQRFWEGCTPVLTLSSPRSSVGGVSPCFTVKGIGGKVKGVRRAAQGPRQTLAWSWRPEKGHFPRGGAEAQFPPAQPTAAAQGTGGQL